MRFNSCDTGRKFSRIFVLILSLLMAMSVMMVSGCSNKDSDGTKPTATPAVSASATPKPALIKNGNFEETYDTSYPKTPKSWTSYPDSFGGETASLSDSKYGIINTESDSFNENTKNNYGDVANPGVSEGSGDDDKNVIMLYNKKPAAIKYKSQSISMPANAYGIVSLYVKTDNINPIDSDNAEAYKNYGAFISLSGMEEPLIIAGINTDSGSGGIWKKFKFYIEGSSTSAKTFYVELGLGSGSPANNTGYTSGHAFFDNVKLEYINKAAYMAKMKNLVNSELIYNSNKDRFFYFDNNKYDANLYNVNRIDTKDKPDWTEFAYSYKNWNNFKTYQFQNIELASLNVTGNYYEGVKPAEFNVEKGLADVDDTSFGGALANYPFKSDKVFKLVNNNYATQGVRTPDYTIPSYSHYRISLFVKTENFLNNGLNIALVKNKGLNDETYTWFNNINTAGKNLSAEDLEKDANIHNKWSNWTEYVFYVEGSPYGDVTVCLEYWLGPENVSGKQLNKFTKGYALFGEMSIQNITSSEYSSAPSGDTVKTAVKLYDTKSPSIANSGFNTPVMADSDKISIYPVTPASWTGYFGGAKQLTGDENSAIVDNRNTGDVYKGIINENYLTQYLAGGYIDGTLTGIKAPGDLVGSPNYLMIRNVKPTAYGYTTPSKTLAASSYYKFSVMVKTYGGAKANIYLSDENGKVLNVADKNISYTQIADTGWTEYKFYIKTGELSKTAKLELWNGSRDGSALSTGYVLYDDALMSTITKEVYDGITETGNGIKFNYEGIDIAPTPTATAAAPSPSATAKPEETPAAFPWGLITTFLIAAALIFALTVIGIRKAKKSKLLKRKKVKVVAPSYSRDKIKYSKTAKGKAKAVNEKEEENDEDSEYDEYEDGEENEDNEDNDNGEE